MDHPLVFIVFRQLSAAAVILARFAFCFERRRPRLTIRIFVDTPSVPKKSPLNYFSNSNLKQEIVNLHTKAKVIGTALTVGGAIFMSYYYHGRLLHPLLPFVFRGETAENLGLSKTVMAPILLIVSCVCWASWFICQVRLNDRYAAPLTSSAMMHAVASVHCFVIAICITHDPRDWFLTPFIRGSRMLCGIFPFDVTVHQTQRSALCHSLQPFGVDNFVYFEMGATPGESLVWDF